MNDKIFYNEASANKLGWKPQDFGCDEFDEDLLKAIRKFQRSHGLTADGMCGPSTFRRLMAEQESCQEHVKPETLYCKDNFIIANGKEIQIFWDKVSRWDEPGGLNIGSGYRKFSGKRDVKFFVNHWDVCLSSKSCAKVLGNRGISVHFSIDNDGTIHQFLDTNDIAWHAGSRKWNDASVGVEITNGYYTKYQSWYEKNGYGKRPVWSGKRVHGGKLGDFLGFYDVQLEALKALWQAIHKAHDIPYVSPKTADTVDPDAVAARFRGFCSHYHLKKSKIDCAGLNIPDLLQQVKNK